MRAVDGSRAAAFAAVLVAFLMGGLLLGTPAAAATGGSGASIALDPMSGLPKTTVTVTVNCGSWDGGWSVSLTAFGVEYTADDIKSGAPSTTSVPVPPNAPAGPTLFVATCTASEPDSVPDSAESGSTDPDPLPKPFTVQATFTVEVPAQQATIVLRPDRGSAGASVSITGDHLPACDLSGWTVVIGGVGQAPEVTDQVESHAVFTVVVPAAAPVGPTEVALDCVGKPVATAAFRVTAPTSPPEPPGQQPPVQQPPAQQPPAQQPPAQPAPASPAPAVTAVVPDLTGLTLAQAASALSDRQLALAPGGAPDLGVVTGQQPAAGSQVATGTAVSVEQAPAVTFPLSFTLPGAGLGVLALAAAAAVLRAQRIKAGREWAQRHVRVVVGAGRGLR